MDADKLEGAELDMAVARATRVWETAHRFHPAMTLDPTFRGVEIRGEGEHARCFLVPNNEFRQDYCEWSPSTSWADGGPLIEEYGISLNGIGRDVLEWQAFDRAGEIAAFGPTALIAAMRALVASGDD